MITPDEIELKTFPVTLRGFDQIEVTRFLHMVASELQSTLAALESARELARSLEEGDALRDANRAAAEVVAEAEAKAEELTTVAAKMRDEASRIRADAIALLEREMEKAARDCEEFRMWALAEIEPILERAGADVSSMLRWVRETHDELPGTGRPLMVRSQQSDSQCAFGD